MGFPGDPVVRNPACNARGHGFNPRSRRILAEARQLSVTTEPTHPRACALNKRSRCNEKPRTAAREELPLTTRRKAQQQQRTSTAETKVIKLFFKKFSEHL